MRQYTSVTVIPLYCAVGHDDEPVRHAVYERNSTVICCTSGTSCFTAAKELGVSYRSAGENIAYGYPAPESVVNGRMNSEGHRKNILSASFGRIGISCFESGKVLYRTQFFIN